MYQKLSVKAQCIRLFEELINLYDLGLGSNFLDTTSEHKQQKKKIDKLDFIKIKSFCASTYTVQTVKRQPRAWETVFTNHTPGKRIVFGVCKELLWLISKKTTQLKNVPEICTDISPKKIKKCCRHVKRCLA